MPNYFECREHGVATTSLPAFEPDDAWVDAMAAGHRAADEREAAAAARWRIYRDAAGWWIAQRGEHVAACFTWEQAHLHRTTVTLLELAADEWAVTSAPGRLTLQEIGSPFTHVFRDHATSKAPQQALAFLRATREDRQRRRDLTVARDRAAAELDVLTDQMNRDVAALAKEQLV